MHLNLCRYALALSLGAAAFGAIAMAPTPAIAVEPGDYNPSHGIQSSPAISLIRPELVAQASAQRVPFTSRYDIACTVRNTGSAPSGPFLTRVQVYEYHQIYTVLFGWLVPTGRYEWRLEYEDHLLMNIPAGGQAPFSLRWFRSEVPYESVRIVVTADFQGVVREYNENNNSTTITIP